MNQVFRWQSFELHKRSNFGILIAPKIWSTPGTFIRFWSEAILVCRTQHKYSSFPIWKRCCRKLTLFHTDATAAITFAGGELQSSPLDILFGKRNFDPGALVLPNRSAGDVGCEIFSYLYQFAAVCLDTMGWQLRLGRMGELIKVEGAGKSLLFAIGLVRPIHNRAMTVLARPWTSYIPFLLNPEYRESQIESFCRPFLWIYYHR